MMLCYILCSLRAHHHYHTCPPIRSYNASPTPSTLDTVLHLSTTVAELGHMIPFDEEGSKEGVGVIAGVGNDV